MAFLFEWQVRAPQATLLELMQCCWWEQGCSAEILDGPQDDEGGGVAERASRWPAVCSWDG